MASGNSDTPPRVCEKCGRNEVKPGTPFCQDCIDQAGIDALAEEMREAIAPSPSPQLHSKAGVADFHKRIYDKSYGVDKQWTDILDAASEYEKKKIDYASTECLILDISNLVHDLTTGVPDILGLREEIARQAALSISIQKTIQHKASPNQCAILEAMIIGFANDLETIRAEYQSLLPKLGHSRGPYLGSIIREWKENLD